MTESVFGPMHYRLTLYALTLTATAAALYGLSYLKRLYDWACDNLFLEWNEKIAVITRKSYRPLRQCVIDGTHFDVPFAEEMLVPKSMKLKRERFTHFIHFKLLNRDCCMPLPRENFKDVRVGDQIDLRFRVARRSKRMMQPSVRGYYYAVTP